MTKTKSDIPKFYRGYLEDYPAAITNKNFYRIPLSVHKRDIRNFQTTRALRGIKIEIDSETKLDTRRKRKLSIIGCIFLWHSRERTTPIHFPFQNQKTIFGLLFQGFCSLNEAAGGGTPLVSIHLLAFASAKAKWDIFFKTRKRIRQPSWKWLEKQLQSFGTLDWKRQEEKGSGWLETYNPEPG